MNNLHFVHIPFDMCASVLHYYQNTQFLQQILTEFTEFEKFSLYPISSTPLPASHVSIFNSFSIIS